MKILCSLLAAGAVLAAVASPAPATASVLTTVPAGDVMPFLDGKSVKVLKEADGAWTVPIDRQLIILGVGTTDWAPQYERQSVEITVNGTLEYRETLQWMNTDDSPGSIDGVQSCYVQASPGDTVTVTSDRFAASPTMDDFGVAWGILVPVGGRMSWAGDVYSIPDTVRIGTQDKDSWGILVEGGPALVVDQTELINFVEIGIFGEPGIIGDHLVELRVNGSTLLQTRCAHREDLGTSSLDGEAYLSSDRSPNIPPGLHVQRGKNEVQTYSVTVVGSGANTGFVRYYRRLVE